MWGIAGARPILDITSNGTLATATVPSGHLLNEGGIWRSRTRITGANQAQYNGIFVPTILNATQFTYTMSSAPGINASGALSLTSPWDQNSDAAGYAAMDQPGRGQGDLLADVIDPVPAQWPNQASEPVYIWNNTLNGAVTGMTTTDPTLIVAGRDFINGAVKPGYTAYTYPHPLATGAVVADRLAPAQPMGFR